MPPPMEYALPAARVDRLVLRRLECNMIAGMPGIGGSPGECQVCGKPFIVDIVLGKSVMTGRVAGMNCDVAVHGDCAKLLEGKPWEELPDGPIRRAFEEANKEVVA